MIKLLRGVGGCRGAGVGVWYGGWGMVRGLGYGVGVGVNSTFYSCALPLSPFSSTPLFVALFIQLSPNPHVLDKAHILCLYSYTLLVLWCGVDAMV
ncbi:hypothetical protein [Bartonella mastomydis]|uniref:hypothetical protein n=1 Tax=Bartonella mastomydis TaxID=1820002 RepID=UPI00111784E6|nr:hypothetical protein [Bartonella mastomydis]